MKGKQPTGAACVAPRSFLFSNGGSVCCPSFLFFSNGGSGCCPRSFLFSNGGSTRCPPVPFRSPRAAQAALVCFHFERGQPHTLPPVSFPFKRGQPQTLPPLLFLSNRGSVDRGQRVFHTLPLCFFRFRPGAARNPYAAPVSCPLYPPITGYLIFSGLINVH